MKRFRLLTLVSSLVFIGICTAPFAFLESLEPGTLEIQIQIGGDPATASPAATFPPTATLIPSRTPIPTVDFNLTTATPTYTPTALPTAIPSGEITSEQTVSGIMRTGVGYEWTFSGEEGNIITIENNSFGLALEVHAPDGTLLISQAEGNITDLSLPSTGIYRLVGRASNGGAYTVTLNIQ